MTTILNLPTAALFDWDNTLVDTWPAIHDAINHTLKAMGHTQWSFEETKARAKKSLRESFPELFGTDWHTAKDIFYTRFEKSHIEQLTPLPQAEQLLQLLSYNNIPLAVVSNKTSKYLHDEIKHLGWSDYFASIVGAGDAKKDKPDPAPVMLALKNAGISNDYNIWFLGDTDVDLLCARHSQCHSILLRRQAPASDEFLTAPPKWHFKDCQALINALSNWAVA